MKKIFTIAPVFILTLALLAGCSRNGGNYSYDEDYWLSRERGVVVYSDNYCPYYVIETRNGYTVAETISGSAPYEGDVVYGDLSRRGLTDIYNYTDGRVVRVDIAEYWLNYYDAQYMIDNLCSSSYRSSGVDTTKKKMIINNNIQNKK